MIPADNIVKVNPAVISAGGNPLSLNGVLITKNSNLPVGDPQSFVSPEAVKTALGANAPEIALAEIYFAGYDNSTVKPGTLWLIRYDDSPSQSTIFGGSLSGMTLEQLQALSGTLIINGHTSSTINFAAVTNFTEAAEEIVDGFFEIWGDVDCVWNATLSRFEFSNGTDPTITYATGTLATGIKFTEATGAELQNAGEADTPSSVMDRLYSKTQNWVSFTTTWEPDLANKELFAEWVNGKDKRFVYVPWDTDPEAIVNGSTSNFGYIAKQAAWDAVCPVYNTVELAVFVLGTGASIDFLRTNARITAAFKHQSGLQTTVTDEQIAQNLLDNGYSFYGIYATSNDDFSFLYNGQISGQWLWLDSFLNQVYLNSQFQLTMMVLLTGIPSIPYNQDGYNLIRAGMLDPINQFKNFGGLRAGVVLSESQKAQVNSAAGLDVASDIELQGWYLQILDPGAQARAQRGSPIINFWYTDGGAVQKITIASINIL